jgi:hypothetical protein
MSDSIYTSLPVEEVPAVRQALLRKAAKLAKAAYAAPTDPSLRERVREIYATVAELDRKLEDSQ